MTAMMKRASLAMQPTGGLSDPVIAAELLTPERLFAAAQLQLQRAEILLQ